jgi:hypothetical protein
MSPIAVPSSCAGKMASVGLTRPANDIGLVLSQRIVALARTEYASFSGPHFRHCAQKTQEAWHPLPRGLDIDRGCSFRYEATGRNDNPVRLGGIVIDIPAGPRRISYIKARVDVGQLLDGRNFLDIGFSSYDNNRVIGGLKLTV